MYDAKHTEAFYDAYGEAEWSRLEATAYCRLQAIIHSDFIKRHVKPNDRVLDAGSGPGRFSITLAQLGAEVTLLDISRQQLASARQRIAETGVSNKVEQYIEGDISNLSMFPEGSFDCTVCFGGALSYVCEKRQQSACELIRVTRPGGLLLVSVMSIGAILNAKRIPLMPTLQEMDNSVEDQPRTWNIWSVIGTGDLPGFPSSKAKMLHPPVHLYTAEELQALFGECQILETVGSNVTSWESSPSLGQVSRDPEAWSAIVELERKMNSDPGLINSGTHIIMAANRKENTTIPTSRP